MPSGAHLGGILSHVQEENRKCSVFKHHLKSSVSTVTPPSLPVNPSVVCRAASEHTDFPGRLTTNCCVVAPSGVDAQKRSCHYSRSVQLATRTYLSHPARNFLFWWKKYTSVQCICISCWKKIKSQSQPLKFCIIFFLVDVLIISPGEIFEQKQYVACSLYKHTWWANIDNPSNLFESYFTFQILKENIKHKP